MCAEWHCVFPLSTRNLIIPPRARGRLGARAPRGPMDRITPACAGKTLAAEAGRYSRSDHPRMRGEDDDPFDGGDEDVGSPPHARGRPHLVGADSDSHRITPACAGKTAAAFHFHEDPTDHPRTRGEDTAVPNSFAGFTGSPPHARGRPSGFHARAGWRRLTPACGKTVCQP